MNMKKKFTENRKSHRGMHKIHMDEAYRLPVILRRRLYHIFGADYRLFDQKHGII